MQNNANALPRLPTIAIVGAGPATVYLLHYLYERGLSKIQIDIFERGAVPGCGYAFSKEVAEPYLLSNLCISDLPPLLIDYSNWHKNYQNECKIAEQTILYRKAIGEYLKDNFYALKDRLFNQKVRINLHLNHHVDKLRENKNVCQLRANGFWHVGYDFIVNNAGINVIKKVTDILDEDIAQLNRINLESPLKIIRHSAEHMQSNKFGRIVNIGSIWSVRSKEHRTLYSGSKFGIAGYTKALAHELGADNVLINTVCPGFIDTELTRASLSDDERSALIEQVPLKRFGRPQEVAEFVEFLLFKNSFITGQSLVIDGGFTA